MEETILFVRIFIGLLFLSSAITKMSNMTKHIVVVKEYKIIPEGFSRYFAIIETVIELLLSVLLIIGLFSKWVSFSLLFLIIIYSTAIVINLFRGRRNLDCGCGGIVGDSQLSWVLVTRNVFLVLLMLFLFFESEYVLSLDHFLSGEYSISTLEVSIAVVSVCSVLFVGNLKNLFDLKKMFSIILADITKLGKEGNKQ